MAFDSIRTPAGRAENVLGGSVNYFSIAASFHVPVRVVGVVGQDFPKQHLEWLSSRNIDVSGVEMAPGKTFHWVGEYSGDMNEAKTLTTALNVFEHFDPKLSAKHRESPYVFLANIDPKLQLKVLEEVRSHKLVVCDSMNFWITGKPDELKQTLKRVDILSINSGEAALLSGETNLVVAARRIREMGPIAVVIKRGEHGAWLFAGEEMFIAPAFPVDRVVDPTGAGDTFAGAFVGHLAGAGVSRDLAKKDPRAWQSALRRAVVSGSIMASFTVEDFGIRRLMELDRTELEAREKRFLTMMTI
ncbi:MAG: sugar kinase [Bdellovibrionales bacterium]|nr:sugar kinase [Bdellovibrionales bacterium]